MFECGIFLCKMKKKKNRTFRSELMISPIRKWVNFLGKFTNETGAETVVKKKKKTTNRNTMVSTDAPMPAFGIRKMRVCSPTETAAQPMPSSVSPALLMPSSVFFFPP